MVKSNVSSHCKQSLSALARDVVTLITNDCEEDSDNKIQTNTTTRSGSSVENRYVCY